MSFSKPSTGDGGENCQQHLRWQENVANGTREYLPNLDNNKLVYIVFWDMSVSNIWFRFHANERMRGSKGQVLVLIYVLVVGAVGHEGRGWYGVRLIALSAAD